MKAFLLAAGMGTRLRPITDTIPKCLVPVGPTPILDIWLELFRRAGVEEVLINLHHHADLVRAHLAQRPSSPSVQAVYEPNLLGSLGTIIANMSFVEGERSVIVAYADNFTYIDFTELQRFHRAHGLPVSMVVFETESPRECGIVELDATDRVVGFEEKPANPRSSLANAGIYVFDTKFLEELTIDPAVRPLDIGFHLLPQAVGKMKVYRIGSFFHDIGTMDRLRRANEAYEQHARLFR